MQLKPAQLKRIEKKINYKFADPKLLVTALCHRSAGQVNNERLEFLGDAVLELIISEELFKNLDSSTSEGHLTRMRAALVRRETLAAIGRELSLNHFVILSPSEFRAGSQNSNSVLADAIEAIIAAIYLDTKNLIKTKEIVLAWFAERLQRLLLDPVSAANKDDKTSLQEKLQAAGLELPSYRVKTISGEAHEQEFTVECQVTEKLTGQKLTAIGNGSSRRRAEQMAAGLILKQLEYWKNNANQ